MQTFLSVTVDSLGKFQTALFGDPSAALTVVCPQVVGCLRDKDLSNAKNKYKRVNETNTQTDKKSFVKNYVDIWVILTKLAQLCFSLN